MLEKGAGTGTGNIGLSTSTLTNSVNAIFLQSDCLFLVTFISIKDNINLTRERHSYSRVRIKAWIHTRELLRICSLLLA